MKKAPTRNRRKVERDQPDRPKGSVPAIFRGVQILDLLAASGEALSLAEITQRVGLPKSSVLALCTSLVSTNLARRTEQGYALGPQVLDWAHTYLNTTDITKEFVRTTDELGTLRKEGVVLAVLDGTDSVYVGCRVGVQPLGVTYRIGMRLPAHCTASGKALLSTLPDARLRELYGMGALPALTPHSHTDLAGLSRDLAEVRRQGYAVDREETRQGMVCIGAPIFDATGSHAVAAVAVSTLAIQAAGHLAELAASVSELARLLSRRLGGRVPRLAMPRE